MTVKRHELLKHISVWRPAYVSRDRHMTAHTLFLPRTLMEMVLYITLFNPRDSACALQAATAETISSWPIELRGCLAALTKRKHATLVLIPTAANYQTVVH
jgi:hypothetical protein